MLDWVVRVFDEGCTIWVRQSPLNILPQVMEVHNLVVFKLLLVETHLLGCDSLLLTCPLFWLRQKLQTVEALRHATTLIKGTWLDDLTVSFDLLAQLMDLAPAPA